METRLSALRVAMRLQWGELAVHIGLSRSMLDQVRKGQRNLSFAALSRLEDAERAAGITPPSSSVGPPSVVELRAPDSLPKENISISGARKELAEIAAISRDLAARIAALEKRLSK
jgi:transcriptional regulator with XRE-family HTH domain